MCASLTMAKRKTTIGSRSMKCFSVLLVGFCLMTVEVRADILDDVGLDDPLNFFWNRNTFLTGLNLDCLSTTTGGSATGICRNYADCFFNGGQSFDRGNCNILQTCCVFQRSCGRSSRAKISTFTNPVTSTALPETCDYRVVLMNPNVCQVRIDMTTNLAGPGSYPPVPVGNPDPNSGKCEFDYIVIENTDFQRQVKRICGTNSNQHVYVRVTPSDRYLDIKVVTSNRINQQNANLPSPTWNLQMTQLECPGSSAFFTTGNKSQAAADFSRLAPDGCLQYFTDVSGEVKSFNYGGNTYINDMNYATCFRRPAASCGVSFALGAFALQPAAGTPLECIDYLYIPERRPSSASMPLSTNPAACGDAGTDWPSISSHPGPLYVHFRSDGTVATEGYRLLFSTASNC